VRVVVVDRDADHLSSQAVVIFFASKSDGWLAVSPARFHRGRFPAEGQRKGSSNVNPSFIFPHSRSS